MPSPPSFVYKIGVSFPELKNGEAMPLSDLDRNDGFIHLSTREQVPGTVGRFFTKEKKVWSRELAGQCVEVIIADITTKTRWEESTSHGIFPHIYGDLLATDIYARKIYEIEDTAQWEALLSHDTNFLE